MSDRSPFPYQGPLAPEQVAGRDQLQRENPGTARPAVDALLGAGTVSRGVDRLTIVDPLFADWLRRRFPI